MNLFTKSRDGGRVWEIREPSGFRPVAATGAHTRPQRLCTALPSWQLSVRSFRGDLSAAEVGLLSLLETTLGPIWVWIGVGERPTDVALLGGVFVIGALALNGLYGLTRARATAPAE